MSKPICPDGILFLDKPSGISSNSALQKIKNLFRAKKAGHTGSLDPLATGMLPVCLGEATKFSRFFLEADKCYQARMLLGISTTTGDCEGEIIATQTPDVNEEKIVAMIAKFQGALEQVPSMFSAIKHQGKPLYEFARQGKTIERAARPIIIHRLTLENWEQQEHLILTLNVHCSKGTYIRTLAEDMGNYLGCGAHLVGLHRLWVAPCQSYPMYCFSDLAAMSLEERHQKIVPLKDVLTAILPTLRVSAQESLFLRQGRVISPKADCPLGWVTILNEEVLVGVGERLADGTVAARRMLSQETAGLAIA